MVRDSVPSGLRWQLHVNTTRLVDVLIVECGGGGPVHGVVSEGTVGGLFTELHNQCDIWRQRWELWARWCRWWRRWGWRWG